MNLISDEFQHSDGCFESFLPF